MKKVLVIAYAFPPMSHAGVFRTLRFCKYLPQLDWQPLVLTIKENPYHNKDYSLMEQLPKNVKIYRTSTIDPAIWHTVRSNRMQGKKSIIGSNSQERTKGNLIKDLLQKSNLIKRIKRFLFNFVFFPDHMIFWIPFALIAGIKILVKENPDVIYTSSPPHSSHLIGLILSKLFRKPWVADFRDPYVDNDQLMQYLSKTYMKISSHLEALIIKNSACVLLNTDSSKNSVLRRYPSQNRAKFMTLTNGFDYDDVKDVSQQSNKKFTIAFTGAVYSNFKTDLFLDGIKLWIEDIRLNNISDKFQVVFVGFKNSEVEKMIRQRKLSHIVRQINYIPKKEAMKICMASHLLLLLRSFNKYGRMTLPTKSFDYFLCKRPILAIVPEGEAAKLVRKSKTGYVVSEDNPGLIAQIIDIEYKRFIEKGQISYFPDLDVIERYNGKSLTKSLAAVFDEIEKK